MVRVLAVLACASCAAAFAPSALSSSRSQRAALVQRRMLPGLADMVAAQLSTANMDVSQLPSSLVAE